MAYTAFRAVYRWYHRLDSLRGAINPINLPKRRLRKKGERGGERGRERGLTERVQVRPRKRPTLSLSVSLSLLHVDADTNGKDTAQVNTKEASEHQGGKEARRQGGK